MEGEYNGKNPQSVVIGSDGAWISGQDGTRLSQIVEFPEKLDCALTPIDPGTVTPPTESPPPTTDPDTLTGRVCGQDLNGNGYLGEQGEAANCVQTVQGEFCPIGSTNCVETFSSPVCPADSILNTSRDMCQANPVTIKCPSGYSWDTSIDKCVKTPPCPDGGIYNSNVDQCEKLVQNDCPTGYSYDAARDVCQMAVNCGSDGALNPAKDRCESSPKWDCPNGFSYNSGIAKCAADPYCPEGTLFNTTSDRCEAAVGSCPSGYTYNSGLDKCVASVVCPSGGSLNGNTDKCELASSVSCPSGWNYNNGTAKCEQVPSCTSPGSYNEAYDLCLATVTGTNCPTGYTWNEGYSSCIASPSCVGGSYNAANNSCEAPLNYSCPDPAYTYNVSRGLCEKLPACSSGTYNSTYDKCLLDASTSCPVEYTYNAGRNRCEKTPECPAGTSYSVVTNRCEGLLSCASGTYNSTSDNCVSYGSYAATLTYTCPNGGVVSGNTCNVSSSYGATASNIWTQAVMLSFGATNGYYADKPFPESVAVNYSNWGAPTTGYAAAPNPQAPTIAPSSLVEAGCPISATRYLYQSSGLNKKYDSYLLYNYTAIGWICGVSANTYSCPTGGTLSGTNCNTSSSYNAIAQYSCSSGDTLSGTTCNTSSTVAATCPSGTWLDGGVDKCVNANPTCTGGNFDGTDDVCWAPIIQNCPAESVYDSGIGQCVSTSVCSNGLLDAVSDVCFQSASTSCPGGFSQSDGICVASAYCASPGTLNVSINYCSAAATLDCPAEYAFSSPLNTCYQSANCGSGSLNTSLDKCQQSVSLVCPGGYILNGSTCLQAPVCSASGSYSPSLNLCDGSSNVCASPTILDTTSDVCYQAASCGTGELNTVTNKCEAPATVNCGDWAWDTAAGVCFSSAVCSDGVYNAAANECQATITHNCGSYSWDSSALKCAQSVACPKDTSYPLNSTIQLDPGLDICVSDTLHICSTGLTWNGGSVLKCEAVPICTGDGIYNPEKDSCFDGLNTCPLGTQYVCMNYSGVSRCSPNACVDAGGGATIETMDESMLKDDARDANGNCLGQLYIFNGKASRCRPPGLTVGLINNCCQSDEVMTEDTGSTISNVASGIQTAYEIGQVAYYGNALASGAAQMSAVTTSASGAVTSMTVVSTATGSTATISGAAAEGAYAAMASGTTGASAVTAGVEAYAAALFNPATIIIAVVVMVVMKVLMGKGCDQADIQTGMQEKAKQCHYVGDYCYKKYFFGCVQKAKSYCCFNSKMARIIQEQGRPQLTTFQPNGDWGAGSTPNCRGFTPDEFQALDFSRIDLSEYFADIQKDLTSKIQNSQQKITDNINKKYQAVQP